MGFENIMYEADGAIVTVELADRRLQEGDTPKEAYSHAAKRMATPASWWSSIRARLSDARAP